MRRHLLFIFFFSFITFESFAISAYPGKVPVVVNNDTIFVSLQGDENCKFASDDEGHTLLQSGNEWYYATTDNVGNVIFSDYKLVSKEKCSIQTKQFLQTVPKGLVPKRSIREARMSSSNNAVPTKKAAVGTRRVLVVLMQFQDVKFSKSTNDFYRLFNEEHYKEDGAIGSVYDFYKWASYDQLDLKSDILGPYTAQHSMSYYGRNEGVSGNDKNPYELFLEAVDIIVNEVNLQDYDADEDGYVDNIHIIFAGYGEEAGASSNAIWAHEMTFRTITMHGMKIDRYSCAPELRGNKGGGISRIGPHCHEIGHALGAMDFYDTDYETGGNYQGTGKWDIMASGSWNDEGIAPADFNPYVKIYNFGWTTPQSLIPDTINTIGVSSEQGNIFRVNTGTKNDYYLLENRDARYFHSAEPGQGLLIFHIGPNMENRVITNTINSTYPQQCYVVCASSSYTHPSSLAKSYGDINSDGCPYPGSSNNTIFNAESTPAALTFIGRDSGISLSNIHFEGEDIVLLFGSSNSEDNPDDPPVSPDESYLWGEDFEQLRLPASWEYNDLVGTGEFSVTTKLSTNDLPESPVAASGVGFAKFVPIPRMVIGEYRTKGCLYSPQIKLAEGKQYAFEISVRKYNSKKGYSKDTLSVNLINEEGDKTEKVIIEEIGNQSNWKKIAVSLPESNYIFSIQILCDIDYGSVMFIDHLNIYEQHQETSLGNFISESASSYWIDGNELHISSDIAMKIFRIDGVCIYNSDETKSSSLYLNKGCYIIRQCDGHVKKILVK